MIRDHLRFTTHKRRKPETDTQLSSSTGRKRDSYVPLVIMMAVFRLIVTFMEPYAIDMGGYLAWSRYMADNGPSGIYSRYHIVYAPFYLYFLWFSGTIARWLELTPYAHIYLIKLWSVLFEALGAILILMTAKRAGRIGPGITAASCYFLNPAVFMNSSVWGQFDSIPATMLLGVIYLFELGKKNLATLLFLAAVLTKPQGGLLAPMVLYLYFRDFRFDSKSIARLVSAVSAGIVLYLAIVLPFYEPTDLSGTVVPAFLDPFWWLLDLYLRSMGDYPFATANGFNFWALAGGQIREDSLPFLGMTYKAWGYILFLISVLYVFYLLYKGKGNGMAVIYCSYLMLFTAFMWMTRMHERYLLPAVIFAVLAAAYDRTNIPVAALTSLCVFANQLVIYIHSFRKVYWLPRWDTSAMCIAAATMVAYVMAMANGYRLLVQEKPTKRGLINT